MISAAQHCTVWVQVEYCPGPGSVWQQYRVTDSLPGPVRARLAGLPAIMEQIKQAHSRPPSLVR